MGEILTVIPKEETGLSTEAQAIVDTMSRHLRRANEQLAAMGEMLRITNERMAALEKTVRTLEKVTPQQAAAINREIREAAARACEDWLLQGEEKQTAAAIRKWLRQTTGVRTPREICRCDYEIVMDGIREWDDYDAMTRIREKRKKSQR